MQLLIVQAQLLAPLIILTATRVGVAFFVMPAPFGKGAPMRVRALLALFVSIAIALPNKHMALDLSLEPLLLLGAFVGELLIGSVIGLTVRTTIAAAEVAGSLAGFSMGLGFSQSVDPLTGENIPATARVLSSFSIVMFLILQGHHATLRALAGSMNLAQPGFVLETMSVQGALVVGKDLLAQGLQIAAPVMGTMFLVQVGKGFVSKAAPQVQLFSMFFAVAIAGGLLTFMIAAPSVANAIAANIQSIPSQLETLLQGR